MAVTAQQAQQELARREIARRQSSNSGGDGLWSSVGKAALGAGASVLGGIGSVAQGAAKEVIKEPIALGAGIEGGLDATVRALGGRANTAAGPTAVANQPGLQSKNLGEKIGSAGVQLAGFMVPEAGASKVRTVVGEAARAVPYLGKVLKPLAKAITSGATGGTVVGLQTGSPEKGASAAPTFSVLDAGAQGLGAIVQTAGRLGEKFVTEGKTVEGIAKNLDKHIVESWDTVTRKAVGSGRSTVGALERAKTSTSKGFRLVTEAIRNGVIKDENGNPIKLPSNVTENFEAVRQTQRYLFQRADEMAKAAGSKGSQFDPTPVIRSMLEEAKRTTSEAVRDSILGRISEVQGLAGRTYSEVADQVAIWNKALRSPMKTGRETEASDSIGFLTKRVVGQMEDQISRTEGAGFDELRRQLGHVKSLEENAVRLIGKNQSGGFLGSNLYNVWSASEILRGAISGRPEKILEGLSVLSAKAGFKILQGSDNLLSEMYRTIDATYSAAAKKGLNLNIELPPNAPTIIRGLLGPGPMITPLTDTSGPIQQVPGVNVPGRKGVTAPIPLHE